MSEFNPEDPKLDLNALINGSSSFMNEDIEDIVPLEGDTTSKKKTSTPEEDEEDEFFIVDQDEDDEIVPQAARKKVESVESPNDLAEIRLLLKQEQERNASQAKIIDDLAKWKQDISVNAVTSVINSKESQRKQAIRDGEHDLAFQLEEEIKEIREKSLDILNPKSAEQPKLDPHIQKVQSFVDSNRSAIDAAITKIHNINFTDMSTVSDSRKRVMLTALQQAVLDGVKDNKSIAEIAQDYADSLNLKTVKPLNRTSPKSAPSSKTGTGDSLKSRFNNLPREARKMWTQGGYERIYQGDLESFVKDTERSFKGN